MKLIMILLLLVSAYSFSMQIPPNKDNTNTLNALLHAKKQETKEAKIDVFDADGALERYQKRVKRTQCCLNTCCCIGITFVALASICLKLEYECKCKQH